MQEIIKYVCQVLKKSIVELLTVIGGLESIEFVIKKIGLKVNPKNFFPVVIVTAIIIILIRNSVTFKKTIKLFNGNKIIIKVGDLFKQKNQIIVIPVDTTFSIKVGDGKGEIAASSLHGKFLENNYPSQEARLGLQSQIQNELEGNEVQETDGQYPIGTIVRIYDKNETYYLLALSSHKKDGTIRSSAIEYYTALVLLTEFLVRFNNGKNISMPLMGNGAARLNRNGKELLDSLLSVLRMSNDKLKGDINIIVTKDKLCDHEFWGV